MSLKCMSPAMTARPQLSGQLCPRPYSAAQLPWSHILCPALWLTPLATWEAWVFLPTCTTYLFEVQSLPPSHCCCLSSSQGYSRVLFCALEVFLKSGEARPLPTPLPRQGHCCVYGIQDSPCVLKVNACLAPFGCGPANQNDDGLFVECEGCTVRGCSPVSTQALCA